MREFIRETAHFVLEVGEFVSHETRETVKQYVIRNKQYGVDEVISPCFWQADRGLEQYEEQTYPKIPGEIPPGQAGDLGCDIDPELVTIN